MNTTLKCEFEFIEFAELAVGELGNYRNSISDITLITRKRGDSAPVISPLAAAGTDVYNGPGGPSSELVPLSGTFLLPAFSMSGFYADEHTERDDDRTCTVKIVCDTAMKQTIADKMRNMGAVNIS